KQPANSPAPLPEVAAERQAIDQPTAVRSETYRPDGTRIDAVPPAPAPSIVKLGAGQPQVLAAAQPPAARAGTAAPETKAASPAVPPVQSAAAQDASEPGFFAQVKSDQDQKAAEAELAAVVEKYKSVLGDVPLITKTADLKEKGIWFRVLAGPVKSRDEAA